MEIRGTSLGQHARNSWRILQVLVKWLLLIPFGMFCCFLVVHLMAETWSNTGKLGRILQCDGSTTCRITNEMQEKILLAQLTNTLAVLCIVLGLLCYLIVHRSYQRALDYQHPDKLYAAVETFIEVQANRWYNCRGRIGYLAAACVLINFLALLP